MFQNLLSVHGGRLKNDGIGGRRFYAAKSMANNDGRRFYFGWAHDRADRSDYGEWYWGGAFCAAHEIIANDGELNVKLPHEYDEAISVPVKWNFIPQSGDISEKDGKITVNSVATNAYGFFDINEPSFMFSCNIMPDDCRDYFGLLVKSDKNAETCCILQFDMSAQRVSLNSLPMAVDPFWQQSCQAIPKPTDPGPDGVRVAEHPLSFKNGDTIGVKILIDNDMIEIFVDEKVAFTYRIYRSCDYQLGIIVQDGNAKISDIRVTK